MGDGDSGNGSGGTGGAGMSAGGEGLGIAEAESPNIALSDFMGDPIIDPGLRFGGYDFNKGAGSNYEVSFRPVSGFGMRPTNYSHNSSNRSIDSVFPVEYGQRFLNENATEFLKPKQYKN